MKPATTHTHTHTHTQRIRKKKKKRKTGCGFGIKFCIQIFKKFQAVQGKTEYLRTEYSKVVTWKSLSGLNFFFSLSLSRDGEDHEPTHLFSHITSNQTPENKEDSLDSLSSKNNFLVSSPLDVPPFTVIVGVFKLKKMGLMSWKSLVCLVVALTTSSTEASWLPKQRVALSPTRLQEANAGWGLSAMEIIRGGSTGMSEFRWSNENVGGSLNLVCCVTWRMEEARLIDFTHLSMLFFFIVLTHTHTIFAHFQKLP